MFSHRLKNLPQNGDSDVDSVIQSLMMLAWLKKRTSRELPAFASGQPMRPSCERRSRPVACGRQRGGRSRLSCWPPSRGRTPSGRRDAPRNRTIDFYSLVCRPLVGGPVSRGELLTGCAAEMEQRMPAYPVSKASQAKTVTRRLVAALLTARAYVQLELDRLDDDAEEIEPTSADLAAIDAALAGAGVK